MVRLQELTGMRPGEVCRLTMGEIDRADDVWFYRPGLHKTAHRGKARAIALVPKARAVLAAFVAVAGCVIDPDAPLFSPARDREERFRVMRESRVSKVPPSQQNRRKGNARRLPADEYHPHAYSSAIAAACEKANVPAWSPNQLRHTFATSIRQRFGLEAAQVLLGHEKADVTQIYAERNLGLAARVAAEVG